MGRAKEQPTKRKTTLPLWPPAGGPQRKTMGGEDWDPVWLLTHSNIQRDPHPRGTWLWSQKGLRSPEFRRGTKSFGRKLPSELSPGLVWAKCGKNDWSQQKCFPVLLWESDGATFLSTFFFLLLLSIGNPWSPAKSASCAPHLSAYSEKSIPLHWLLLLVHYHFLQHG